MKKQTNSMVTTIPITKARINLGAVVKRIRVNKEYFILEKDGIPVAGLMDIDEFEDYLEMHDPAVKRHIAIANSEFKTGKSRPAGDFLAELTGVSNKTSKRKAKA